MAMIQPELPGLPVGHPTAPPRQPRRRMGYTRVWHDPGVVQARAADERQASDWRAAFARFLAGLPPERRDEIRQRLRGGVDRARDGGAPPSRR